VPGAEKILTQTFARYPFIIQAQNSGAKISQRLARLNIKDSFGKLLIISLAKIKPAAATKCRAGYGHNYKEKEHYSKAYKHHDETFLSETL
jgi:hypothetical protein